MQTQIFQTYDILCKNVAEKIVESVSKKPNALICLGSGDTPIGVFEYLVKMKNNGEVDFSNTHFVGLDEWLGMDENDEGSCFYTMYQKLFIPLKLEANQIHCFNAKSEDLENECKKINDLIKENGGLDLILLGIGTNGHLAMNEPGTPFNIGCHVSKLADSTISTGQKYFKSETPLQLGITVGLKHIAETKEIMLMANGAKKAEIIHKTIYSKPDISLPSSILKSLNNVLVMLDDQAASLLA
jgi:glucosamine-6-phosphate isomerase